MLPLRLKTFKGITILLIILIIILILFDGYKWSISSIELYDNSITFEIVNNIQFYVKGQTNVNDHHQDTPIPCYLLHKTHKLTPHIIDRMKKAKQDIEEWNCKYSCRDSCWK